MLSQIAQVVLSASLEAVGRCRRRTRRLILVAEARRVLVPLLRPGNGRVLEHGDVSRRLLHMAHRCEATLMGGLETGRSIGDLQCGLYDLRPLLW